MQYRTYVSTCRYPHSTYSYSNDGFRQIYLKKHVVLGQANDTLMQVSFLPMGTRARSASDRWGEQQRRGWVTVLKYLSRV